MSRTFPGVGALLLSVASIAHVGAAPASAQELVRSSTVLTLVGSDTPATLLPLFPATHRSPALTETTASTIGPDFSRIRRPKLLPALYAATVLTQVLDAHSTRSALSRGAREVNPVMQGVASNGATLLAVKVGAAAGTVFIAEKLWRRNRVAAIAMMVAVNVATAGIAAHNYSVASRLQ
jgi:Domain of unknown function (DUF5658)